MVKLSVIYYSATGHGTTMARTVAEAAEKTGAEVRLRHVAETRDPKSFAENPAWTANFEATKDLPAASGDDIVWADAVIFGSPTRFGSPAAPFRAYIDTLGGLWAQGKLADKVYAAFTSSQTAHGGQETTPINLYVTLMHSRRPATASATWTTGTPSTTTRSPTCGRASPPPALAPSGVRRGYVAVVLPLLRAVLARRPHLLSAAQSGPGRPVRRGRGRRRSHVPRRPVDGPRRATAALN